LKAKAPRRGIMTERMQRASIVRECQHPHHHRSLTSLGMRCPRIPDRRTGWPDEGSLSTCWDIQVMGSRKRYRVFHPSAYYLTQNCMVWHSTRQCVSDIIFGEHTRRDGYLFLSLAQQARPNNFDAHARLNSHPSPRSWT